MWWICNGCDKEVDCDPHSHSDTGGVIEVQGPRCKECDEQMYLSPDQEEDKDD